MMTTVANLLIVLRLKFTTAELYLLENCLEYDSRVLNYDRRIYVPEIGHR